jgi:hypothetical protein
LVIVSLFEIIQLPGQFAIGGEQLPQFYEGAD